MTRPASLAAFLAVLCLAIDPLLAEMIAPKEHVLIAKLCGSDSGEMAIQLGKRDDGQPHCPKSKACHAANCRKQFDPAQRRGGE